MRWVAAARERLRGLFFRAREEAEMDEEMRFHVEMEAERLVREERLPPAEARRRARVAFGGMERFREEVRDARGLAWVTGMSLDLKLGLRMLRKYPGLSLVGGLAMAFAIGAGAAAFEVVSQVMHPRLPLDEGDRIVGLQNWDAEAGGARRRLVHDFAAWRTELRTVRDVGAFRTVERNLVTGAGEAEPVRIAEISASAFRVARVPPLLGRTLVEADEAAGADPVVVLGHDVWRARFGGDPAVVGRAVRFGREVHTVVGVMPEGFGFPVSHGLWMPLRVRALDHERGKGPQLHVFGRLADGVSLPEARAELATFGRRAAADHPDTHRHLRPEVLPYVESLSPVRFTGAVRVGMYSINLVAVLFLALICANVSILVFARTAARQSELLVRNALGASRRRILLQLFAEALVLGAVSAALGLAVAVAGLRWGMGVLVDVSLDGRPFWWHAGLSPATVLYVAGITLLGAGVVGVLPALKVTGRSVETRLRQAAVGGTSLRFGGWWTGVIVTQVALTMVILPILIDAALDADDIRFASLGVQASEYLSLELEMDGERAAGVPVAGVADPVAAAFEARFAAAYEALERRLEAEPEVAGVTFGSQVPGGYHGRRWIEVEGVAVTYDARSANRVQTASVAVDFFEVLGAPMVAGRGFHPGDLREGGAGVIVNQEFVERVLGGRGAVGRRVRYLNSADPAEGAAAGVEPGPWHEIVGVVRQVGMTVDPDLPHAAGLYHPVAPGGAYPAHVAVRVRGTPESFAPRLRAAALAVDPGLRLYDVRRLDEIRRDLVLLYTFWLRMGILAGGLLLLLSFAGIYSILSFTVSRRTREIGIRTALGANPRRIVTEIFSRALAQLGMGVAAGIALLLLLGGGIQSLYAAGLLAAGVGVMVSMGLLACLVPTRRALRIQPTEALKAEA